MRPRAASGDRRVSALAHTSFGADWLELREPLDLAARDPGLLARFGSCVEDGVVQECGAGHGALLRAVAPALRGRVHWHAYDHDTALLAELSPRFTRWGERQGDWRPLATDEDGEPAGSATGRWQGRRAQLAAQTHVVDLAQGLPMLEASAIACSAWLDLVSADWLTALGRQLATAQVHTLYLSMTINGEIRFTPASGEDELLVSAYLRHMEQDKGFGPALGPAAQPRLTQWLDEGGYALDWARSDWRLDCAHAAATRHWLRGLATAAVAHSPMLREVAEAWLHRRRAELAGGWLQVEIGHFDLLATRN